MRAERDDQPEDQDSLRARLDIDSEDAAAAERRAVRGGDVSDEEWERQLRQVHPNYVRARRSNRFLLLRLLVTAAVLVGVMLFQDRSPVLAVGIGVGVLAFVAAAAVFYRRRDEL